MQVILCEGPAMDAESIDSVVSSIAATHPAAKLDIQICRSAKELSQALDKMAALDTESYFPFKTTDDVRFLKISQVRSFQGQGHRILVTLDNGETLLSRTMRVSTQSILLPLTARGNFLQVSRSHFINVEYLQSVSAAGARMKDGELIYITRNCYTQLCQRGRLKQLGSEGDTL